MPPTRWKRKRSRTQAFGGGEEILWNIRHETGKEARARKGVGRRSRVRPLSLATCITAATVQGGTRPRMESKAYQEGGKLLSFAVIWLCRVAAVNKAAILKNPLTKVFPYSLFLFFSKSLISFNTSF